MNITDYKSSLIAREDIDDIVAIEPVDMRKVRDGYEQVEHQLASGRTMRAYDVHVIGQMQGAINRFTIPVLVYNQGLPDEEVVELRKTKPVEDVASAIDTYIASLPFVGIRNLDVDKVKLTARFEAIQVTGPNAGKEVKVFAYKPGSKAATYLILE